MTRDKQRTLSLSVGCIVATFLIAVTATSSLAERRLRNEFPRKPAIAEEATAEHDGGKRLALLEPVCNEIPSFGNATYILQAERFGPKEKVRRELRRANRDLIILDQDYVVGGAGKPGVRWTETDLQQIRGSNPRRRILAYLSIGEAEDYREYWQDAWDRNHDGKPAPGAPAFLADENPAWAGNYAVRYWRIDWVQLIASRLLALIDAGFDGVYLDKVDEFEFFEFDPQRNDWIDNRQNPETAQSYREDMITLIAQLSAGAKLYAKLRGNPCFIVVPQNGSALLQHPFYRSQIDGIAVEDLFTDGNRANAGKEVTRRVDNVRLLQQRKPVLIVEYPETLSLISTLQLYANVAVWQLRATTLATTRDLTRLGSVLAAPAVRVPVPGDL